jgi:predicted house-cleaning NTP pyrophosphatase (Maf/HAM1 superfamily)
VQGKGAVLVERVEGNVQAVMGLPLAPLPALFARVGLELTADGERLLLSPRA